MTGMIPFNQEAAHLTRTGESELSKGISGSSLKKLSMRGKVWRIKLGEEEHVMKTPEGAPIPRLTAVIVRARDVVSNKYYGQDYAQGQSKPPICGSESGVTPDSGDQIQNASCVTCKWNQFKSAKNGKGKACSDYKRIVIAVYDEANGSFLMDGDAPLVLAFDVAAMSFKSLRKFDTDCAANGAETHGVVASMYIDPEPEYPSVEFTPIGKLSAEQFAIINELRESVDVVDTVSYVIADAPVVAPVVAPVPALAAPAAVAPVATAPVAPPAAPAPTPPPPPAEAPAEAPAPPSAMAGIEW